MANGDAGRWLIYAISCDRFHKVGITGNLAFRLHAMALTNPLPIRCVMYRHIPRSRARAIEKIAHATLAATAHGREWFTAPLPEIRAAIEEAIKVDRTNARWSLSWLDPEPEFSVSEVNSVHFEAETNRMRLRTR